MIADKCQTNEHTNSNMRVNAGRTDARDVSSRSQGQAQNPTPWRDLSDDDLVFPPHFLGTLEGRKQQNTNSLGKYVKTSHRGSAK